MNRTAIALTFGILAGMPGIALADQDHDSHHAAEASAQTMQPATPAGQMQGMQGMETMSPECMAAMQKMMQGNMQAMMQQMMQGMTGAPAAMGQASADSPAFTREFVGAMGAMHGPMMAGVTADDADLAFVKGMIPHHQGAIEMARIVAKHGDDPQTKAWAEQIIAAQEREIGEMQAWLTANEGKVAAALARTGGIAYSANEGGNSISTVNLANGEVGAIALPIGPHNVDLSPDGKYLIAVGNPVTGAADGAGGHGHDAEAGEAATDGQLVILDPANTAAPKAVVAVGAHPAHVVADRQGRAYVSLAGGDEIAVVDLAKAEVIGRIATGAYPHGLRLSPDESALFVANVEDGSVSVIDTQTLAESDRIKVGKAPVQVGFTPSGDRLFVSLRDENRVAIVDPASREVLSKVDVGRGPIQIMATPDGAHVYVANQGSEAEPDNSVSVIDAKTGQVVKTIVTGRGAHGVSASGDGAYVFVTNLVDDSVSIIDAASQQVVRTVAVGDRPNGIAYGGPAR